MKDDEDTEFSAGWADYLKDHPWKTLDTPAASSFLQVLRSWLARLCLWLASFRRSNG